MDPVEIVTQLPQLPLRRPDSNKGDYGRVLIVAGSRGMTGAAILCGSAALRGGAGLVRVATPADVLPVVATGDPCYMTAALTCDEQGRLDAAAAKELPALLRANDVAAVGPGLGQSDGTMACVLAALASSTALVLDADALNILKGDTSSLHLRSAPLVLTPHPGEFARLIREETATVQNRREEFAATFAATHGLALVLKGHVTLVTDGKRLYRNTTGNPGMATGGSGDVLTGLIVALLGQGLAPFAAAQLGVYLHGLAGDLARESLGETSLIATDLIDYLPKAFARRQKP
jgi:ADP-dependent NAD(P)H-hydrate dehydratase